MNQEFTFKICAQNDRYKVNNDFVFDYANILFLKNRCQ